jgi:hypothetical protein
LADGAWVVTGDRAFGFGGRGATAVELTLWQVDLATLGFRPLGTGDVQAGPGPRRWASLAVDPVADALYLYGGLLGQRWRNDLWRFDLQEGLWELVEGECRSGPSCPPPASRSALLASRTPGSVTVALGNPVADRGGAALEWRYVLSAQRWVTEDEARNLEAGFPPGPSGGWCSVAPPGGSTRNPFWSLVLLLVPLALLVLRRRAR